METIGRYHIDGELGKGAMGVVYKATDPNIGRTVALKTMRLDVHGIEAEEMLQRFRNEARAAGVLNHPNIVTIYDAGECEGLFYMAMEVIEGDTLQQLLSKHRVLPVEQILSVCRQVGEGLDFAHARGVIHRDIKPANIMVTASGLVKIMDFGIAKAGGGLTSTGQVLGTPNYMSPEQVKGRPLDGRTDLFSLGVVLYEMLAGEKPFGAQNVTTIIYKIVHEEPISPRELDVSIHPGLSAVVMRSLSKAPDERYQTGTELAKELENYKSYGTDLGATQTMHSTAVVENAAEIAKAAAAATVQSPTVSAPTTVTAPAVRPAPTVPPAVEIRTTTPINVKALQQAAAKKSPAPQKPAPVSAGSTKGLLYGGIALLVVVMAAFGWRSLRQESPADAVKPAQDDTSQPVAPATRTRASNNPSTTPSATPGSSAAETAPGTVASAPAPASGAIAISTRPDGATVKLDGKRLAGATPLTQKDLAAGKHTLQISAPGYLTALRSVDVAAGATATADVTLVATAGIVKLNSVPAGADIFLDGVATAKKTPTEFSLPKGDHTFMVRLDGYDEAGDLISVVPGQTISFAPTLTVARKAEGNPFRKMGKIFGGDDKGQLVVSTDPAGAFVFINGRRIPGQTPLNVPVAPGRFYMAIRKPGFRPVQKPITIEKGKPTNVTQSLTAKED